MIDPLIEQVISLTDAAKLIPSRRGGKRTHASCIYRWTTAGCKGVLLESIQCGGTRCTSKEAIVRFFRELTDCERATAEPAADRHCSRETELNRANADLDRAGIR